MASGTTYISWDSPEGSPERSMLPEGSPEMPRLSEGSPGIPETFANAQGLGGCHLAA